MITITPGVWTIFRGWPWVWSCITPSGRQCASGLSLLFSATRWRWSSAAQGWNGRPSLKDAPRFQNWLVRTEAGMMSLFPGSGLAGAGVPGGRWYCHTPDRSGLPSAVLGVGPERFGLPSAVLGTPGVG